MMSLLISQFWKKQKNLVNLLAVSQSSSHLVLRQSKDFGQLEDDITAHFTVLEESKEFG